MSFPSLVEAKRDGRTLSAEEIQQIIREFTAEKIPDYQMAALLMAIYFRGLDRRETRDWTLAMRDSGQTLRFPADSRPLADKHSTGGVGDKVSLPLAPLLAELGFRVPMISGRGLGITGGTLDKLESIPGFQTHVTSDRIIQQVQSIGCVICSQTTKMAPADKRLYALRDVTGTVPSIPLITASILSKKLAEGLQALVLDVKFGRAAFMRTREEATQLADSMVQLGTQCGLQVHALLNPMDVPLGRAAGNWVEVKESVECLEGCGPDDLRDLVVECAAHLLVLTDKTPKIEAGRARAADCLKSGTAYKRFRLMLEAQGANLSAFDKKLNQSVPALELRCDRAGRVTDCNARTIGEVIRDLGGGRTDKDATINHDIGLDQIAKPGDSVEKSSILCRIHGLRELPANVRSNLLSAFAVDGVYLPST
ncbi:MAG TPA: thymidine phosphorylase [Verrucomicrobiae bacterium]|nr:thymidine phosphorylase [Verrucomicrobiae bacterium]